MSHVVRLKDSAYKLASEKAASEGKPVATWLAHVIRQENPFMFRSLNDFDIPHLDTFMKALEATMIMATEEQKLVIMNFLAEEVGVHYTRLRRDLHGESDRKAAKDILNR